MNKKDWKANVTLECFPEATNAAISLNSQSIETIKKETERDFKGNISLNVCAFVLMFLTLG